MPSHGKPGHFFNGQIDSEYEFKEIIGEGSFGKVHKAALAFEREG